MSPILPPTQLLPPIRSLSSTLPRDIEVALKKLTELYNPSPSPPVLKPSDSTQVLAAPAIQNLAITKFKAKASGLDIPPAPTPDSGYASAYASDNEDDEEDVAEAPPVDDKEAERERASILASPMEKAYTVKWLTRLIGSYSYSSASSEEEEDGGNATEDLLDEASSLLSILTSPPTTSSETAEDVEDRPTSPDAVHLTRIFNFPLPSSSSADVKEISVTLNDAPLASTDHTSVGLQSWASAQVLAERMVKDPLCYGLAPSDRKEGLRILELGAGTGLVSLVAAKIIQQQRGEDGKGEVEVYATDFHPSVLSNLALNVSTNFPSSPPVKVAKLDWESPSDLSSLFQAVPGSAFDVILAADVVYLPSHARLLLEVATRALRRPDFTLAATGKGAGAEEGGTFFLAVPFREQVGRHAGVVGTIDEVFSPSRAWDSDSPTSSLSASALADDKEDLRLAILEKEEVPRLGGGVGRADEGGYLVYRVGWQVRA